MCVGDSSPILDYSFSLPNPLALLPLEFPKSHTRSLLNIHPSESNGNDGKGPPKSEASNEKPSPPGHSSDGGGESEGSNKKPSPPVDSNHDDGSNKKPSPPEDNGHDNSEGSYKTPPPPDSDHPPSQTPPIYVTPPSTPSYSPSSHSPPTTSPSSPPWSTPPTPPTTTPTSPSPPSQSTPSPTPPTTTPSSPLPTPPTTTPSSSPSPPSSSTPSPTPPTTTPSLPSPQSLSTPPNTTASPSTPTPTPPTTPSNPTPSTHTPTPPTSSLPPPSTPSTSPKTARCKNKYYPRCYNTEHVCPSACPGGCEIDCATCKPVCKCDRPGAVCQDPRFIGGDGITFYFHGKKDHDFCLVSDPNLHINAHFIGKRNENLTRDFTWVQSISIFFDKHQLFLGALKASTWDDSADRLSLAFDGEPLNFPGNEGSKWQSTSVPSVSITRISDSNNVVVEVEGLLKITAKVVPITEEDSRIHNYGITSTSTFQRR
ncbi:flocculation protein FLO11-like [Populus alba x Populus x berolinensis]|nr:flocculation protein FLO11-like [Populus alba x Populus x berolinensis]